MSVVIATKVHPPTALRAYAEVAADYFPQRSAPDRCVNASWIFVEVMRRLGFSGAKAVSVEVSAMNAAYQGRLAARTPEEVRHWVNRGPWAVVIDGLAPDPAHTGWAGHVVGIVQSWLVDTAVSQMSRPAKDIVLPEVLVLDATAKFCRGKESASAKNSAGCMIRYRVRPTDRGFERLPGFRTGHQANLAAAADIEGEVRARLRCAGA
jgi:hypothetical protein